MSKIRNIAIDIRVVDRFLASFGATDIQEAKEASAQIIAALKEARQAVTEGFERKELTVCSGRAGYADPADMQRLIRGEIPRMTVYRKKKDKHNMPLYFKTGPGFYSKNKADPVKKAAKRPARKVTR